MIPVQKENEVWRHLPALRFSGYTSREFIRLQYELKHGELPGTAVVELIALPIRRTTEEWFNVRIQVDKHDDIHVKPEDIIIWLPHCVLHICPNETMFAYFPNGVMTSLNMEGILKT